MALKKRKKPTYYQTILKYALFPSFLLFMICEEIVFNEAFLRQNNPIACFLFLRGEGN